MDTTHTYVVLPCNQPITNSKLFWFSKGAGKSTVIKTLIDREQAKTTARPATTDYFPAPVTGRINDLVPTSGDVHLYSDPQTYSDEDPILYADCEGLNGGEKLPMVCHLRSFDPITRLSMPRDSLS
jgi:hypothetical protein